MSKKKVFLILIFVLAASLIAISAQAAGLRRVTGSGHVVLPDGTFRVATISAIELPNGKVIGEAEGIRIGETVVVGHFGIDCLQFLEFKGAKAAIASGTLEHVVNPIPGLPEDVDVVIGVVDFGEGHEGTDIFTRGFLVLPGTLNCTNFNPLDVDNTPIDYGNVQVSD